MIPCPVCGAYGDMQCSTVTGKDHRARWKAELAAESKPTVDLENLPPEDREAVMGFAEALKSDQPDAVLIYSIGATPEAFLPILREEQRRSATAEAKLVRAIELLEYVLHLRVNGERAPGGDETWAQADRDIERFLRDRLEEKKPAGSMTAMTHESNGICFCGIDHATGEPNA